LKSSCAVDSHRIIFEWLVPRFVIRFAPGLVERSRIVGRFDAERDAAAPFTHPVGCLKLPHEFAPPTRP
jgi:hypothetical protein